MTKGSDHAVGVRVQSMSRLDQTLLLCVLLAGRQNGVFKGTQVTDLFQTFSLPGPTKIGNTFSALGRSRHLLPTKIRGEWRVTPLGRAQAARLLSQQDLAALEVEASYQGVDFASTHHTVVPPSLAPPEVLIPLGKFLERYPFETNVFGMTRFPDEDEEGVDPVAGVLVQSRLVLEAHGMTLHLASDRAISDDLWANVSGHMWASSYGIAFFEDRLGKGLNYNLTIEVGAMLMTGRRCLLLKDASIEKMPTDLVGRIYKLVDLDDPTTVERAIHDWARNDLRLGACKQCPSK
jgi:hypothetical protein